MRIEEPRTLALASFLILASACGTPEPQEEPTGELPDQTAVYRDSSILDGPGGRTVWWTDGRRAVGADGQECHERVMEIRSPSDTVAIPLLYTGAAPVVVDDTTIEAVVWRNCLATDRYLVDLRTGRPTRVER